VTLGYRKRENRASRAMPGAVLYSYDRSRLGGGWHPEWACLPGYEGTPGRNPSRHWTTKDSLSQIYLELLKCNSEGSRIAGESVSLWFRFGVAQG
jgi:hypothetical protein